jgi:hypothetical protein
MIEITGLVLTGFSTIKDLLDLKKDLASWKEDDVLVDPDWLLLAQEKGILAKNVYEWSAERSVATRELKGSHTVAIAYNEERKIKYRVVKGHGADRLVLMKRI